MPMSADQLQLARMYLSDEGSSAVQSILIQNAIAGTFTITWNAQTTIALAWNASAADVQNALCALSNVGLGNITVNNTYPYVVYFQGTLGEVAQAMLTVNVSGLSGSGVTGIVTAVANGGQMAFTDSELGLLYDQADQNFFLAICYAFRAILADFARISDYVAGQTQEKRSQITNHLQYLQGLYQEWAFSDRQVQFSRMAQVPPRVRAYPIQPGVPATSLSTRPPSRWKLWGR